MTKKIDIVLASNNRGKIKELSLLLQALPIRLIAQAELGVTEVEETGLSFIENALIKARHAATLTGLPALADDSGIAVPALQGAPGIYSARYAGAQASDSENILKLLSDLAKVAAHHRSAFFYCAIAFMSHASDPMPLICSGHWSGILLEKPQGRDGFGYDPIFYLPEAQKTAAEMPLDIKNKISHRGKAIQSLLAALPDKLCTH